MKYLTEQQVSNILSDQPNLIRDAILEVLQEQQVGGVRQTKTSLRKRDNSPASDRLTSMMGFIGVPPRVVGFKLIGSSSENHVLGIPRASVMIVLCDPKTHAIQSLIDGTKISLQRTSEMAVLGIHFLCPDAKKIAIIGTGDLAQSTLQCVQRRMPQVENISILGRENLKNLGLSQSISADVVITATSSDVSILSDSNLKQARLVINLGLREISSNTIPDFDEHFVDDFQSCANQKTPFAEALKSELIIAENVRQISTIVNSSFQINPEKRIYFQPSGMVAIDLLTGDKIIKSLTS